MRTQKDAEIERLRAELDDEKVRHAGTRKLLSGHDAEFAKVMDERDAMTRHANEIEQKWLAEMGKSDEYTRALRVEIERLRGALQRSPHRRGCEIGQAEAFPAGVHANADCGCGPGHPCPSHGGKTRPCSCGRDAALSPAPASSASPVATRIMVRKAIASMRDAANANGTTEADGAARIAAVREERKPVEAQPACSTCGGSGLLRAPVVGVVSCPECCGTKKQPVEAEQPCSCEGDAMCPKHYAQLVALVHEPPKPVPALAEAFKRLREWKGEAEQPKRVLVGDLHVCRTRVTSCEHNDPHDDGVCGETGCFCDGTACAMSTR